VIYHVASRVLAAYSGTGIFAFIFQAGLVAGTLGIEDALGTTRFVRIADVLGQTSALAVIAYGVRTARRESARIRGWWYCNCGNGIFALQIRCQVKCTLRGAKASRI